MSRGGFDPPVWALCLVVPGVLLGAATMLPVQAHPFVAWAAEWWWIVLVLGIIACFLAGLARALIHGFR